MHSISFQGVSKRTIGRSFIFFNPSGDNVGLQPKLCLSCSPSPSSTSEPSFLEEFRPSCMYCSAFRWALFILDLPGSAPFFVISSLFDLIIQFCPLLYKQFISRKFCLDHLCRLFAGCCLFAPHHGLLRSSQASIVCFEYRSVHPSEVSLFLVFQLVGNGVSLLLFVLLFLHGPLDKAVPLIHLSCRKPLISSCRSSAHLILAQNESWYRPYQQVQQLALLRFISLTYYGFQFIHL